MKEKASMPNIAPTVTADYVEMDSVKVSTIPNQGSLIKRISESGQINISNLSQQEIEKYSNMTKSLVVTDINSISNYGSDLQNTMTKYSNDFLKSVRASQCGEVGGLINNLLQELGYVDIKDFDETSKLKKFLRSLPLIGRMVKSVEQQLAKYDTIVNNVDAISKKITATRLLALRDNSNLQVMFENNLEYGKQIEELIIAGKIKLQEIEEKLNEMQSNPEAYEAHEIQDLQSFKNTLERRIADMLTLRFIIKQSLPQIRTVQYNNLAVADKAQTIITTTIPIWRNQLSIAVALKNQRESIKAQNLVTETTNEMLLRNSEVLKENSIFAAKENERGVVDIETLRKTTESLISTFQEVKKIHEEASANRAATEQEIIRIEKELEDSMTSMIKH